MYKNRISCSTDKENKWWDPQRISTPYLSELYVLWSTRSFVRCSWVNINILHNTWRTGLSLPDGYRWSSLSPSNVIVLPFRRSVWQCLTASYARSQPRMNYRYITTQYIRSSEEFILTTDLKIHNPPPQSERFKRKKIYENKFNIHINFEYALQF